MSDELRDRLRIALDEFLKNDHIFPATIEEWLNKWSAVLLGGVPIPMLLYCPKCNFQHVDFAEPSKGWTNPPHRTHYCKNVLPNGSPCAHNWRPSDYYTTGVRSIGSRGIADGFTQPGGIVTTVLQPTETVELATAPGFIKRNAARLALNIGARLLLGKTKPGQWIMKTFNDNVSTFEHRRQA